MRESYHFNGHVIKKVDLVIVQDASGSFKDTIGSVKSALNKIIDQLDHQTDRVMVTSYQDYRGFKDSKGNTLWEQMGQELKRFCKHN